MGKFEPLLARRVTHTFPAKIQMEPLNFGLFLLKTPEALEISGKTFFSKESLKALGGTWDGQKRVWVLPLEANLQSLRLPPPKPQLKKVFRAWICAKKRATLDPYDPQGPMLWVCDCCGAWKSDYAGT